MSLGFCVSNILKKFRIDNIMNIKNNSFPSEKPKLALVVASVLMVKFFLEPHLKRLGEKYDVTLFLKNDRPEVFKLLQVPVKIKFIDIHREINLFRDITALIQLVLYMRREKFQIVHTLNPKAGLLGMISASMCLVPIRIHTFQGEIWANKKGIWRWFLRALDKVVAYLATRVLVVSASEREFLISEGIIAKENSSVLAHGSIGGVDIERFKPDVNVRNRERSIRRYTEDQLVFLYLGRINKDKGIKELLLAFEALIRVRSNARLLLVGPDDGVLSQLLQLVPATWLDKISYEPYTSSPENVIRCADVLVLPSYREGFGVVIIEAAAAGVTAIGSRIYGISDALVDEKTGLMCTVGDPDDLARVMMKLLDDAELRAQLACNARMRVMEYFRSDVVIEAFIKYYDDLLDNKKFLN